MIRFWLLHAKSTQSFANVNLNLNWENPNYNRLLDIKFFFFGLKRIRKKNLQSLDDLLFVAEDFQNPNKICLKMNF